MMYTRLSTVMKALDELAAEHGCLTEGAVLGTDENNCDIILQETVVDISSLQSVQRDVLFVKLYNMFVSKYYEQNNIQRKNDLSYARAYNKMVEFKKKSK